MLPRVSKVVLIAHPQLGAMLGDQVADVHATVADRTEVIEVINNESLICIPRTSNFKLVQMRIRQPMPF